MISAAAAFGAAASVTITFIVMLRQIPAGVIPDAIGVELPEGKHYHSFDRSAKPQLKQAPGWYCACGQRAPESKQPKGWKLG